MAWDSGERGGYGARDTHNTSNAQFEVKQYRAMAVSSSAAIMIEGEVGKGVSAYSLVGALRAMLGKPANREADSKAFNNLKETRPLLQNLPTVTISRRSGTRLSETPALSTMQQVDAVIDSMSYTSIAAGFRAQYIGHSIKVGCPALITARIPLNYARSLGLVAWPEGMQPPPVMDKSSPSHRDYNARGVQGAMPLQAQYWTRGSGSHMDLCGVASAGVERDPGALLCPVPNDHAGHGE